MIAVTDPRVTQSAAQIVAHQPWFVEFLKAWRQSELEKLAYVKDGVAMQQGRVQSLDELLRLFNVDRQRPGA